MRMSLLDPIDHDRPRNATTAWVTADKWAFSEIYFRCKPGVQHSLSDNMTARQAWTLLEDVYHSASSANIFRLTIAFNSLRQKPEQPILSFINDVIAAATDLKLLGEDVNVSNSRFWPISSLNMHH